MKPTGLYMFVDASCDSSKHKAVIETSKIKMVIQGVGNIEEAASMAMKYVDEGASIIELCGGFGYGGAKAVSDAVGEKAQVSMTMSQILDAPKLTKILGNWL